ncbi:MAG: T9SS type A sorting domain-containing protein [Bacteroidia bacterium]|nr:T9SS type A sorting domain-containing protein [Bacteroidia bacterium]
MKNIFTLFVFLYIISYWVADAQPSCTGSGVSVIRSNATGNWDVCATWNPLDVSCAAWPGTINENRYHNILNGYTVTVPAAPVNPTTLRSKGISVLSGGKLVVNKKIDPPTNTAANIYVAGTMDFQIGSGNTMDFAQNSSTSYLVVCSGGVANITSGTLKVSSVTVKSGGTLNMSGGTIMRKLGGITLVVESGGTVNINSSSGGFSTWSSGTLYTQIDGTFDCKNYLSSDATASNFSLGQVCVASNTTSGRIRTQTAFIPVPNVASYMGATNNFFGFNSNYGGTVEYYGSSSITLNSGITNVNSCPYYYDLEVNLSSGAKLNLGHSSCTQVIGALYLKSGNINLNSRKILLRGTVSYTGSNYIESNSSSDLTIVGKLSFIGTPCETYSTSITTDIPSIGGTSIRSQSGSIDIQYPQLRFSASSGGSATIGTLKVYRSDVVFLRSNLTVTSLLSVKQGILKTDETNLVYLSNASPSAFEHQTTGYSAIPGWISGPLKRKIGVGSYDFGVGYQSVTSYSTVDRLRYRLFTMDISALSGYTDLKVKFVTPLSPDCDGSLVAVDGSLSYLKLHPEGYWNVVTYGSGTITYDEKLYIHQFTSPALVDNQFGPLKRSDGLTECKDWSTGGGTLNAASTSGRIHENSGPLEIGYAQRNGLIDFSDHGIGITDPPPMLVELADFQVSILPNTNVLLKWATAKEVSNQFFVIQRSSDGQVFEDIKTIAGAGNSHQILNYQITDSSQKRGLVYYRLKMIDYQGKSSQSEIKSVFIPDNEFVNAYFSQADILTIQTNFVDERPATIEIYNLAGKVVFHQNINILQGYNTTPLAITLPQGIYYLKLTTPKSSYQIKFIR